MRRFEFSEGASNKFWEIEQDGVDLVIRWGRIGTQGQSQTKHFADAAKATSALDKLVSEKAGKGYVEAGAGTAAAATAVANAANDKKKSVTPAVPASSVAAVPVVAAPAPAVTATAPPVPAPGVEALVTVALDDLPPLPSLEGATPPWLAAGEPLDFDAAMKRLLQPDYEGKAAEPLPSRRFPGFIDDSETRRAWMLAKNAILQDKELDLAACDPTLVPLLRETWGRLEKDRLDGSDESQALLLALACALAPHGSDGSFARHLVAQYGLAGALQLLVQAHGYAITVENDWKGGRSSIHKLSVTCQVSAVASLHWSNPLSAEELRFRRFLAQVPEPLWLECAALIEAALPALHPARQVALALLLPDAPELSNVLALRLAGPAAPDALHWLQLTATDPAALAAIQAAKVSYGYFFHHGAMLATVLQERRLDALRLFAAEPALDNTGDVLTYFGVPEAVEALVRVAGSSKTCLQRLNVAAQRWPLAAIPALARVIAASGREAGQFVPVLSGLLQSQSAALPALRPWLAAPAAAVVERLLAQLIGPAEVADAADLPRVLADPPWLKPRKTLANISALAPLPLPTQAHWPEDERERAAVLGEWQQQRYAKSGKDLLAFVGELGFNQAYGTVDEKLEVALRDQAVEALRTRDMDALHSAWTRMKANRRYLYLTVDGGLIGQLPDGIAIEVWNRLAGDGSSDSHVAYMLARFGLDVWPGALRAIRRTPASFTDLALKFADVELAVSAARALVKLKTLRQFGRDWLLRHPEYAAAGLIAPALGKAGEARDCAGAALRFLAANGHEARILDVAARYGRDDVDAAVRLMLAEDPLDRFPSRRSSLPAFWAPRGWRRPLLRSNGKALPDAALDHLGSMLAFPSNEALYPGIAEVVAACTSESLGDFAWDLFNAWLAAAAPSKDGWGMAALGWLGNDDTARRLTPLIRNWPGEGAHARAVLGLDVLAAIGSDVALMLLNGIAQKVKFKGLQDKAREKIDAIAEARSLSTEELEDRLAPDLGLDDVGTLLLDFGPRQFRVGFDEALKPYVRDSDGARLADLPKPKKTDDAVLAAAATGRFKLLKKDARTIASQQVLRLEIAMCTRRRWGQAVFEQFLAGHPLLRHLVQRLVWGIYEMDSDEDNQGGRLLQCFRVAEDGSYGDADDAPLSLPQGGRLRLGLPHALELPAQTAAAFGQLFADYELMQPFQQLGRESFALSEEERATLNLQRWKGKVVPTGRVLGLANKGWRRGAAQDGGGTWYFTKSLVGDLAIELNFEPGIIVGLVDEYPQQTLLQLQLQLQVGRPGAWGDMQDAKPFAALDPIAASELIRDMQSLCA
jgi:predicted DNA-binding WGR domain protein